MTLVDAEIAMIEGRTDDAAAHYTEALRANPTGSHAHYYAAVGARKFGDKVRAKTLLLHSLALDANQPEAWHLLGRWVLEDGDAAWAVRCFTKAVSLRDDYAEAWLELGRAAFAAGDPERAYTAFHYASLLEPTTAEGRYNLSFVHQLKGEWREAWEAMKYRFNCPAYAIDYRRDFHDTVPLWDGKSFDGTLLVHGEQGMGDVVQCLRYLWPTRAYDHSQRVILEVHPALVSWLRECLVAEQVIARGDSLPHHDKHIPTWSLPALAHGYIPPPLHTTTKWRDHGTRTHIGICWAGSPDHPLDAQRSMSQDRMLSAFGGEEQIVSLQHGRHDYLTPMQGAGVGGLRIRNDWLETVRTIQSLDLVITVDTAVAHVAATIGCPTWVLLPALPDPRWMLDRADTPWYPAMRLFRQPKPGDWDGVCRQVSDALAQWKAGHV